MGLKHYGMELHTFLGETQLYAADVWAAASSCHSASRSLGIGMTP